ncbi:hypothetical protein STEG23_001814 [Scotinomys teguina]
METAKWSPWSGAVTQVNSVSSCTSQAAGLGEHSVFCSAHGSSQGHNNPKAADHNPALRAVMEGTQGAYQSLTLGSNICSNAMTSHIHLGSSFRAFYDPDHDSDA